MKKISFLCALLCASVMMFADNFVKVTSTSDIAVGDYLIVYEDGGLAMDGSLAKLDAVSNSVAVTITDNAIEATDDLKKSIFTIEDVAKGYVKSASGKYIGATGDANGLADFSEAQENTLSIDEDGNFQVVAAGKAVLRYNATSGQTRFRYYKSATYTNQKAIALYKLEAGATAREEIVFTVAEAAGNLKDTTFSITGLTLTTVDPDGKIAIDGNDCRFGNADAWTMYNFRMKTGGKSNKELEPTKNYFKLNAEKDGNLIIAVRTGSNNATDRNLVAVQGGVKIFDQIIEESVKITVKDGDNDISVYPYITIPVKAGEFLLTYPVNGLNFYAFAFEEVETPALEPATWYGAEAFTTEGTVIDPTWSACEYNITRNADKTLTFVAEFTDAITGLVGQVNLDGTYQGMAAEGLKFTYTTTATYEDGTELTGAFFYFPYAGAAKRIDIVYTVGTTNDKPATPEKPAATALKGTYKIGGEVADYASLSAAIQDIEDKGMAGDVTLLICADLAEDTNIGITNNTDYTLKIAPDAAVTRTITYGAQADNAGPSGHIIIGTTMAKDFNTTVATKNVVFDGSFDGEGQYLEFVGGAIGGNVLLIYGNVTNTTIKNCRLIHPRTTGTNYALHLRSEKNTDNAPVGIVVENCYLQVTGSANAQVINLNGSQASTEAGYPTNTTIRNCEIVSNLRGVFFNKAVNATFEGNTFRFPKASSGFLAHGIMGNSQKGTIVVRNNKFIEMASGNASAGEYGLCGITASGGSDVWIIENNYFAGLDAKADVSAKAITLRYVRCGDSCVVRHNTFYIPSLTYKPTTELVAASPICALYLAGAKEYPVENNIFVSEETTANNSLIRGALNANVKNNVFYHKGGNAAILAGAAVAMDWATFTADGANAGSVWKEVKFVDAANGNLDLAEADADLLMPQIDGITTDIYGTTRAAQTYAGAFEYIVDMGPIEETWFANTAWQQEFESYASWDAETQTILVNIKVAKASQWQAQVKINTAKLETPAIPEVGKKYNVSLKMKANKEVGGVTLKYQDNDNAQMVYADQSIKLLVNEEYVYEAKDLDGMVGNNILVLDFGWAAADTQIEIYDISVTEAGETPSALDQLDAKSEAKKVMIDGQVYIIRDGKTYNMMGVQVR